MFSNETLMKINSNRKIKAQKKVKSIQEQKLAHEST
jgi:hypothetical protein